MYFCMDAVNSLLTAQKLWTLFYFHVFFGRKDLLSGFINVVLGWYVRSVTKDGRLVILPAWILRFSCF